MKIEGLHVASVHPILFRGGLDVIVHDTGKLFASMGIHLHYYTVEWREAEWQIPDPTYCSLSLFPEGAKLWNQQAVDFLIQELHLHQISVLLIPNISPFPYLDALRSTGVKLIFWNHGMPLWEYRAAIDDRRFLVKKNLSRRLEWIFLRVPFKLWTGAYRRQWEDYYRRVIEGTDLYLTLCPAYARELAERLHLPAEQASKLVPLINTLQVEPHPTLQKEKLIIFVGRLSYADKRVDRVIDIWARAHEALPDWRVEIHGTGPDEERLKAYLEQKGLPRIRLCGYAAEPSEVYRRASVLLLTSTHEGWGMVLAEAQNHGVVPMAFACSSGVRAVLGEDERAGVLIRPFSLSQYAQRLIRLCRDTGYRAKLQQGCLSKRLEYSPERSREAWAEIFQRL
jgi:glycosyltransferase, family 1